MKLRLKTRDSGWFPGKRTIGAVKASRGDWGYKSGGGIAGLRLRYPESGNYPLRGF